MQRHQNKTITVYNDKRLKKSCLKSDNNAIDKKVGYCCIIQHVKIMARIMTNNILPGYVRILGTPYNL